MRRLLSLALLALLVACPRSGHGARFRLVFDLTSPTPAGEVGGSVGALEDRIVLGSSAECGGAFLFDAASGALIRALGELPCQGGSFGEVVAAGGRRIAVAWRYEQRVSLFDADGHLERTLSPTDLEPNDYGFGTSLALNAWLVVVGGARTGVYVFDATTGDVLFRLTNAGAGPAGFGAAVAFSGGTIVVGDPLAGTVYGFAGEAGTGTWRRTVPNRRPRPFGFGQALAGDAGLVAVGGGEDAGGREVVLVLETTRGTIQRRYRAPRRGSGFGAALALQGKSLVVGAPFTEDERGVAYLYRLDRLPPLARFRPRGFYRFRAGQSVAFSGDRVVVGAPKENWVGVFAR